MLKYECGIGCELPKCPLFYPLSHGIRALTTLLTMCCKQDKGAKDQNPSYS